MLSISVRTILAIIALVLASANLPARADDTADCRDGGADQRLAACTKVIEAGKGSLTWAYNNRGWARNEKNDTEGAIADLNEAIRLSPRNFAAFQNRGWSYEKRHDYERALADYDEAIRLKPDLAYAYTSRGSIYSRKGDHERALVEHDIAIRTGPNLIRPHFYRANTLFALGRRDEALAEFRIVLELPATTVEDKRRLDAARERVEQLTNARSASIPKNSRVALVIGNARYEHAGTLTNPPNDATAVAAALRRLGFSVVIEKQDASLADMTRALRDFGDQTLNAEWAVVYFAGHGLEMNGTNYLVPVDAVLQRDIHVGDEAVSLDRLLAKVETASKLGLVILDSCRNNPFAARMVRSGKITRAVGRGLASVEPDGNVLVAYAARHGTTAEDGSGNHSPFTEALLGAIEQPDLEVSLLFRTVRDAVRKKTSGRQDPFVYGSLGSEQLFFKPSPARVAK